MRKTLMALTATSALLMSGAALAQAAQPSNPPAASTPAADAAAKTDDQSAQSSDSKAGAKAKAKDSGGTVVRAGPNAGMIIGGKSKKAKDETDVTAKPQAGKQPGSENCTTDHPCR